MRRLAADAAVVMVSNSTAFVLSRLAAGLNLRRTTQALAKNCTSNLFPICPLSGAVNLDLTGSVGAVLKSAASYVQNLIKSAASSRALCAAFVATYGDSKFEVRRE